MRCIIVDDEPLALELLEDNIKLVDRLQLVASCRSAAQAIQIMQDQPVDLVFCDIKMPAINGLQFVKGLQQRPMIIFITAYEEFALDGFELDVIDYLLKPVPLERFLKACNKALNLFDLQKQRSFEPINHHKNHFFVYADYNLIKLSYNDITYIEGLKDYVKLHRNGQSKPILSRVTIKALVDQLPADQFFRTHKSYIVNLAYVQSIRNGRIKLEGAEVPYGENYKEVIGRMTGRAL
ncbi:MAG: DNA-binding response regulator [Mucilaginibacter sp.]|nr:DNA-binding response regulator [Mucilaginibacter sp.]